MDEVFNFNMIQSFSLYCCFKFWGGWIECRCRMNKLLIIVVGSFLIFWSQPLFLSRRLVCYFAKLYDSLDLSHVSLAFSYCIFFVFNLTFEILGFEIWEFRMFRSKSHWTENLTDCRNTRIQFKFCCSRLCGMTCWNFDTFLSSTRHSQYRISSSPNQWRCGNHIAMIFMVEDWGEIWWRSADIW